MTTYQVQLLPGGVTTVEADRIVISQSGALLFQKDDPSGRRDPSPAHQEFVAAFAPGQWAYVIPPSRDNEPEKVIARVEPKAS